MFGEKIFNYSINFVPESIKDLIADSAAMGSTACVRCGATLIPHLYCDVCHDVLCFTCSSCSMNTVERIHAYCHNASTPSYDDDIYLQDTQKLIEEPISSQLAINNNYINTHYHIQNQLNDKIKDSSIELSTSYWNSIFKSIKLVNRYWSKIFNISNSSSSIA
jgi:hypothetical protein